MNFVSFGAGGTMVASDGPAHPGDVSGDLTFWSFPDGKLIRKLPGRAVALSADWKYYATAHGVRNAETGQSLTVLGNEVYAVHAFSSDSRYVAESPGGQGVHIHVLELPSGKEASRFGKRDARSLAISPDGMTLAAGYWDVVTLWNVLTGERLAVLQGFGRYVEGLSFSKDGHLLAATDDLGGIEIWDVQSHRRLHSLQTGGGFVSEPVFSPDARWIAVGVYGLGTVFLIDVTAGKIVDHQKVSDIGCGSVAFSPDGRFLITPSTGGLVKWPYDRGGTIRVFKVGPQ
jgi:WD40 repeat protein